MEKKTYIFIVYDLIILSHLHSSEEYAMILTYSLIQRMFPDRFPRHRPTVCSRQSSLILLIRYYNIINLVHIFEL
jgi:hypothetical protein